MRLSLILRVTLLALWHAVSTAKCQGDERNLPEWNSRDSQSFHFEVHSFVPTKQRRVFSVSRLICDHHAGKDALLWFKSPVPHSLFVQGKAYRFLDHRWQGFQGGEWGVQLDVPSEDGVFRSDSLLSGPFVVDLRKYLTTLRKGGAVEVIHDQTVLADISVYPDKTWVETRFRTPNDEFRLGEHLSELLIIPSRLERGVSQGRLSVRSFTSRELASLRMMSDQAVIEKTLFHTLGPDDQSANKNEQAGWLVALPQAIPHRKLHVAFSIALADSLEAVQKHQAASDLGFNQSIEALRNVIRSVQDIQRFQMKSSAGNELWFDDPPVRWRHFEEIGRDYLAALQEHVYLAVCEYGGKADRDFVIEYVDAVADLGSSNSPMEGVLPRGQLTEFMPGYELFIETIFRSRHMYHVEPEEIDATAAVLAYAMADSETERVAVETLLRLDEYDRCPAEAFERWWSKEIVKADKVFRWDTISMLTLHSGNRAMLIERLPQCAVPLRREIWKNLRLRAESTVRMKRWDFMSEAECQKILALPEPPVPGKNADGGPARAFPVDE